MRFKQLCAGIAAGVCLAGTILPVGAFAEESTQKTYTTGLFTYGYVDGGLEICGVDTSTLSATIPAETDGNRIVGIADGAFYGCTNLKTAIVDTKHVGMSCFKGCKNLTTVVFRQPYVLVRSYAFYGCKKLGSVYMQNDDALDISCLGNCYLKDAPKTIMEG